MVSREVTATVLTMTDTPFIPPRDGDGGARNARRQGCLPDVILMDAQMPGLSGTELIAELRARTRRTIYAISGSNPPQEVAAAADGFLLKPFDAEALASCSKAARSGHPRLSRLDPTDPVVNPETLAQFRGMMPEPAVREIYSAVVADLVKRIAGLRPQSPKATPPRFVASATPSKAVAAWPAPFRRPASGRLV